MRPRTIGLVLIAVGLVGLVGTAWVAPARRNDHFGHAPGAFYGPAGAGHVRVALTASDEAIAEAAARLRGA